MHLFLVSVSGATDCYLTALLSEGFFGKPLLDGVLRYPLSIGLYVIFCSYQKVSHLVLLPVIH